MNQTLIRIRHRSLAQYLSILLIVAPAVGLLGVTLAEAVPDSRIANNLLSARSEQLIDDTQTSPSPLGTIRDHWTECLVLSIGLGDPPRNNIVTRALISPSYTACVRLDEQLNRLRSGEELDVGGNYLRYWHGYTVFTRPALAVFGLAGTRWLAYGLLSLCIVVLAVSVARDCGRAAAAMLVTPLLLTTDSIVGTLSIAQAIGVASAWIGAYVTFSVARRCSRWQTVAVSAALAGTISAYLDLMTTLPGALALVAFSGLIGSSIRESEDSTAGPRMAMACVVGWLAGLCWMWTWKWIFAAIVVGWREVYDSVSGQISFRMSGQHGSVRPSRFGGIFKNVHEWWIRPLTPALLAVTGLLVCIMLARSFSRQCSRTPPRAVLLAALAVIVSFCAWFVALNNHTQIHAWLVYRSIPLAYGGLCAFLFVSAAERRQSTRRAGRPRSDWSRSE